jgi:hypothetical protein
MAILHNRTTRNILAYQIDVVAAHAERPTATRRAEPFEGSWLERCHAVHSLGNRASVDLVFLDRDLLVVRLQHAVRPGRALVWCRGATSVLEMRTGFLAGCDLLVGDQLAFEAAQSA